MEFALALTLLAGAGLAIHSFWNLSRIDLGVDTHHILTFSLPLPEGRLKQPEEIVAFYRQLLEKLRAIPGVVQRRLPPARRCKAPTRAWDSPLWGNRRSSIPHGPMFPFKLCRRDTSRPSESA